MWEQIADVRINVPAINRKVRQIRHKAKMLQGKKRIEWLIKAIECIDLTSLGSDDTDRVVRDLCKKALNPIPLSYRWPEDVKTAAVCVYPKFVPVCRGVLQDTKRDTYKVPIAAVSAGFPTGLAANCTGEVQTTSKLAGVSEIDIVIDRSMALMHQWDDLRHYLQNLFSYVSYPIVRKIILGTGELFDLRDVYKASIVAMNSQASFIKTSTGKETINATLPAGVVMCRAIRDYTISKVGLKPAGGIKTAQEALEWMMLVQMELGDEWLDKKYFRIGASSLLDNIIKEIRSLRGC